MSKGKILVIILTIILAVAGVYIVTTLIKPGETVQQKSNKEILSVAEAKQKAFENTKWFFWVRLDYPKRVEVEPSLAVDILRNHYLFHIYGGRRVPAIVATVAVNKKTGDVFQMPGQFNSMIQGEEVFLSNDEEVLNFTKLYLYLAHDPRGRVLILQRASDIPYEIGSNRKSPQQFSDVVTPPQIRSQNWGFTVEVYSWVELGGQLEKWTLELSTNGYIMRYSKQVVGKNIGLSRGLI